MPRNFGILKAAASMYRGLSTRYQQTDTRLNPSGLQYIRYHATAVCPTPRTVQNEPPTSTFAHISQGRKRICPLIHGPDVRIAVRMI